MISVSAMVSLTDLSALRSANMSKATLAVTSRSAKAEVSTLSLGAGVDPAPMDHFPVRCIAEMLDSVTGRAGAVSLTWG